MKALLHVAWKSALNRRGTLGPEPGKRSRGEMLEALRRLVTDAECVIGADAGMFDRVLRFVESCRPGERARVIVVKPRDEGLRATFGVGADALASAYGEALARLSEVDPSGPWLTSALAAAERMERTHRRGDAFVHGAEDPAGGLLLLADQVHMARGLATLAEATADPRWSALAERTVAFAERELRDAPQGGFFAHTRDPSAVGVFAERQKPLELNATLAELLLEFAQRADDEARHARALAALRDVARPDAIARQGRKVGALVLALDRAVFGHFLLSVVGERGDPATQALHRAALALQRRDRLVELGEPGNSRYPFPGEAAVYLCSQEACSLPFTDPEALAQGVSAFARSLRP